MDLDLGAFQGSLDQILGNLVVFNLTVNGAQTFNAGITLRGTPTVWTVDQGTSQNLVVMDNTSSVQTTYPYTPWALFSAYNATDTDNIVTAGPYTPVAAQGEVLRVTHYGVVMPMLGYNDTSDDSGYDDTGFGFQALWNNVFGSFQHNSAFGFQALFSNTLGADNSAFGFQALFSNTLGAANSAFGIRALFSNTLGNQNSAFGNRALYSNTIGFYNSAFGDNALFSNTTGAINSAFGQGALQNYNNTTSANGYLVAIGYQAGYNYTGSEVNNIILGASSSTYDIAAGIQGESNVIRIGNSESLNAYLGGPIASSTATLLNSVTLNLLGAYWNGTASVPYGFEIYSSVDATTPAAHLSFNLNNNGTITEFLRMSPTLLDLSAGPQIKFAAGTTGAGSASLGSNSPATTLTAPYTWLKVTASDGSQVYVPAWK